jgi:formylglycine-generating enzyme required for sulfatase activity
MKLNILLSMIIRPLRRIMPLVLICSASSACLCPAADTQGSLPKASKDQPFVNSLGMKFVPVPDTEVLFCIHETRWRDYATYDVGNSGVEGSWREQTIDGISVVDRAEDHPVMRVSWEDAKAFCAWLSRKDGRTYRLPTDEEWSTAVGLGRKEIRSPNDTPESLHGKVEGEYPWGTRWPPSARDGNYSDLSRKARDPKTRYVEGYNDGYPTTAPVMSFKPNQYGLYDMGGDFMAAAQPT